MKVLMIGVDESTKGGMWTVVENYLNDKNFVEKNNLKYIPTSITGCSALKKIIFTLKAYLKIVRVYKKETISILHVHMSERASIIRKGIVMKYAKRRKSKIVLHMHGAEFEVLYNKMSLKKQKKVREILNLADKIIILGNYWKSFISNLVDNPEKVCVVYNAVYVPDQYKYQTNSSNILFLGAVSKRKGIDVLIKALKNKEQSLRDKCKVNIYGPDVEKNIDNIIYKNNLNTWVFYKGWLGKNDKSKVLSDTSINVLPSYNEGLPMTILEAMSYGIPTISTSVAAIPEAVNKSNGILISPGDDIALGNAIEELIVNNKKRLKLSEKSYEDAKYKFSIKKHISDIQKIYADLMKNEK